MNEYAKKSILEMARGGFLEVTDLEMTKAIANIMDPNTSATAKRKITVTIILLSVGGGLTVALLSRIQSGAAHGADTIHHNRLTPAARSGRACTAQRPPSPWRTGGTYHAHNSPWQVTRLSPSAADSSGQYLFFIIFLSWGGWGARNVTFSNSTLILLTRKLVF